MQFPPLNKSVFSNLKKQLNWELRQKQFRELRVILKWIGLKKHFSKDNLADFLSEHIKDYRQAKSSPLKLEELFNYSALGDSTVEGLGATSSDKTYPALVFAALKQLHPGASYNNFGRIGAIAQDIIDSQLNNAIENKPKLITISVGANDVMRGTTSKDFRNQLNWILKRLTEETDATIVINNIPDFSTTSFVPLPLRYYCQIRSKMINKIIRQKADEWFLLSEQSGDKKTVVFIDLNSQSKVFKDYPGLISGDGLHPSDLGYALWATTIISQIYQILFPKKNIALGY